MTIQSCFWDPVGRTHLRGQSLDILSEESENQGCDLPMKGALHRPVIDARLAMLPFALMIRGAKALVTATTPQMLTSYIFLAIYYR